MFKKLLSIFRPARRDIVECCHDCEDRCAFSCILDKATCDNHKCHPGNCGCYTKGNADYTMRG